MSEPYLSIIIPAYNEEKRIGATLDQILRHLQTANYEAELILVDDGSNDQTIEVINQHLRNFPFLLIRQPRNQGKGSAVKKGMLAAGGQCLLFSDADLSTPIQEVDRFLRLHEEGYDCVIGSRALEASKIEVRQIFFRELMGKVFNRIARLLSFQKIKDSQCGFKSFKRAAAKDLFANQKLAGFAFDAEILYLAQKKGYKIREEPVIWRNALDSRVKIVSDPVKMFSDLLKIRWLHRHD